MKMPLIPIVAIMLLPLAEAATINVDFNTNTSPTYTGTAVLGGGVWNGVISTPAVSLLNSDGAVTSISFNIGSGTWDNNNGNNTPDGVANDLLRDYRNQNNNIPLTLTISGLAANGMYDLVLYAAGDNVNQGSRFSGSSYTGGATTAAQRDHFAEGVNYSKGTAIADGTGAITITINSNGSDYAILNGFQISAAPVPEPTAAALGLLGSLALLRRRRR